MKRLERIWYIKKLTIEGSDGVVEVEEFTEEDTTLLIRLSSKQNFCRRYVYCSVKDTAQLLSEVTETGAGLLEVVKRQNGLGDIDQNRN